MEQNTNTPKPEEETLVTDHPTALPWVKWHTKLLTSIKWRSLPMGQRGVFAHLVLMGGVASERGKIDGTDVEIADLLGCPVSLVTATIDRLSRPPFDSIERTEHGLRIVKWDLYQVPSNFDPAYQQERKATASAIAGAIAVTKTDKTRQDKTKTRQELGPRETEVWDALADVPGYPRDHAKDAPFLAGIVRDYAILDVAAQVRHWAAYKIDKPFGPRSSPRSQLRAWLDIALREAVRSGATVAVPTEGVRRIPSQAEQARERKRKQNEEARAMGFHPPYDLNSEALYDLRTGVKTHDENGYLIPTERPN